MGGAGFILVDYVKKGGTAMKLPLQITFRNMESSEAVEESIRKWAAKLDRVCDNIIRCAVVVEAPHKRRKVGGHFRVRIDITVPGRELVINREPDEHHSNVDVYVCIRDAFNSAKRQLEEYVCRRKGYVKVHEPVPHGRIASLFPEEDYGRIATADGREIYFHRNSILDADFDKLEAGMEVRFSEEEGDQGTQASTVRLVGKHHIE